MKRYLSALLSLCLCASLFLMPAARAADSSETVLQTIRALGIMTGDENGRMNLTQNVTRAQFAKMMVAASSFRDTVGTSSGISLFKDVKQNHWAVEYIRIAVEQGWFIGYTDGTFHPDSTIRLEEAATAVLRLLGYTSEKLPGTYPSAQLTKYAALGLDDGVSKTRGQIMSRTDCMYLFYNMMTAQTQAGQIYAAGLGYSVNAAGQLDYASLVAKEMNGPYVLQSGQTLAAALPFDAAGSMVFLNGKTASLGDASVFDVYYYSKNMRTVWLYRSRVSGVYTAASPNTAAPSSVTVAGNTYSLGTSSAVYKLSSLGGFAPGDSVTLLLDKNGAVCDVIAASETEQTQYGVVIASGTQSYTDANGAVHAESMARVVCTDGVVRQYGTGSTEYEKNALISVSYPNAKQTVSGLSGRGLNGVVNASGTALGTLAFSASPEIIEVSSTGEFCKVYPARLAGAALTETQVLWYQLDTEGKICRMILKDATGDAFTYGLLTSVTEISGSGTSVSGSYEYLANGKIGRTGSDSSIYNVSKGGVLLRYEDGEISGMKNLASVSLTQIGALSASAGSVTYPLADGVQIVQKLPDGSYTAVNLSTIADVSRFSLTGYYDQQGFPAGGRIRVIVAIAKA